jgi:hypothetical protein
MTPTRPKGALMKQPTKQVLRKEIEKKDFIIEQLIASIKEKDMMIKELIKKISG